MNYNKNHSEPRKVLNVRSENSGEILSGSSRNGVCLTFSEYPILLDSLKKSVDDVIIEIKIEIEDLSNNSVELVVIDTKWTEKGGFAKSEHGMTEIVDKRETERFLKKFNIN